jgi:hypothetical protein
MGIPETMDFKTYIPNAQLGNEMNTYTVQQLLTGSVSLGQRSHDQTLIPPCFIKVSKGRDKGSYILEGHTYQQSDIKELCESYLLAHLQNWVKDEGDPKQVYIKYAPTRNSVFSGTHGYPISAVPEEHELEPIPSVDSDEISA